MSSVAARPDVTGPVEQVMAGELFSGLLFDDIDERAAALETLLGTVVDDETRVVWVGNPLRSPLTIERFLIQIVGPEIDLREERSPAELARIIATPIALETRLLVVVQQPETINAETIHTLVQMGWYLSGEAVQVQFLFTASSAFVVPRLAGPDMNVLSDPLESVEPVEGQPSQPVPRRRDVFPLLLLLLAVSIGVLFSTAPVSHDDMPVSAPPAPDVSVLRREFDAFLAQRRPRLPAMSKKDRAALLTEILTHDHRE